MINLNYSDMKAKTLKIAIISILLGIISCDEPETVVTNIVHPDGSITRKIEMRNSKENFKTSDLKVPFDSSWTITDSLEISEKGDTTWIKRAVKDFLNTDEINLTYKLDSGLNRAIDRKAELKKTFRWFNTVFRFSETIGSTMKFGYPVKNYLSPDELLYYYSPGSEQQAKQNGPDSLKYRAIVDSISEKTDRWLTESLVSEWIGEFTVLTSGKNGIGIILDSLNNNRNELTKSLEQEGNNFDSLWACGAILNPYIGENGYQRFKTEADTALEKVTSYVTFGFGDYSERISMPGRLTGSNGYADSSHILVWPVKSDYFLTEPYIMWAESKLPNKWAWIVSGLFIIFVATGFIIRVTKKRG